MPSKHLYIIRMGLIAGVFAFAGIAIFQRTNGMTPPGLSAELPLAQLRYALWAAVAVSGLGTLLLYSKLESGDARARGVRTILGWALGEAAALFGIVLHFAGAPVSALALGLVAFIFALLMLPVPRGPR